ncbi:hypothetical protein FRB93_007475 [Tulasnella sp. JGI-2019a]|nr:hypothetical protein FRB93_007475 [Tulasnella sp. JGI-2019a]
MLNPQIGKGLSPHLKTEPAGSAHLALSIPYILEEIIKQLSNCERAVAARLSSQWHDIALGKLWKDLDSVLPLLKLISPLVGGGQTGSMISFHHVPNDVKWNRFGSYACRVRSICWNDEEGIMCNEIFAQIFFHRPHTHPLLPNIEAITWFASCENTLMQFLPMVCDTLKTLNLRIRARCPAKMVATALRGLDDRSVRLERLDIQAWFGVADIEIPLVAHLCNQWELRTVGLPQYYGTKDIITVLGNLPKLEALYTTTLLAEVEVGMKWELGENSFSNLLSFGFNAPLMMAKYIFTCGSFSRLLTVSITTPPSSILTDSLEPFFVTLASCCPILSSIHLDLCQYPANVPVIAVRELASLFTLGHMEVMELDARKPVVGIDRQFVSNIAVHWPMLRRLRLTPEPTEIPEGSGSPMTILRTFAEHFGTARHPLKSIGLYFSVNRDKLLDTRGIHTWTTLDAIDVGTSRIEERDMLSVASFLGGICRPGLMITAGRGYTKPPIDHQGHSLYPDEGRIEERWMRTEQVLHIIHTFMSPLRYVLEVSDSEVIRTRAQIASLRTAQR